MDWVTAKIALGGDQANVMFRGPDSPVSWPEVRVLQFLHGDENVFDSDFVRSEPATIQAEKMRLLGVYGAEVINMVYPGARPAMELDYPGDKDAPPMPKRPEKRPLPSRDRVEV